MRVVVIGGYGNFGARVCRALSGTPAMEIVAAGRHPDERRDGLADLNLQHARLDHSARDFAPGRSSRRTTASRSPRWRPARTTSISPTAGSS